MSTPKDDLAREIATAQQLLREFSEFAYDNDLASDEGNPEDTAISETNVALYLRDLAETLTKIEKAFRELE